MRQIMSAFASYIDVPEAHLQDHSVVVSPESRTDESRPQPVRIHSGKEKPESAYTAVYYRDYWYWVDNDYWLTERAIRVRST